jgi:hypothetical protein
MRMMNNLALSGPNVRRDSHRKACISKRDIYSEAISYVFPGAPYESR